MKKYLPMVSVALALIVASAYADRGYELCKGHARGGVGVTVTGNYSDPGKEAVEVNADGKRETYEVSEDDSGDVEEAYSSKDHGGLRITFYDEDNSASGWTSELGAFKLKCEQ